MELQRIYPDRAPLTPDQAITGLDLAGLAAPDRPYVVLNMVATADGKATIAGRTGPIGNAADRALFHHLRTQVDAVMVGAGTIRTERYGRLVRDPALREKRRREGLAPDPLAVLVSGSLNLPADLPLLSDPDSTVLVLTSSDRELEGCAARIDYLRAPDGELELGPMLRRLREEHGIRSILCEGGPTLNSTLLPDGLVDELFLSVAAKLIGGSGTLTIVDGLPLPEPVELRLVWALEAEGHLFLRYALGS